MYQKTHDKSLKHTAFFKLFSSVNLIGLTKALFYFMQINAPNTVNIFSPNLVRYSQFLVLLICVKFKGNQISYTFATYSYFYQACENSILSSYISPY